MTRTPVQAPEPTVAPVPWRQWLEANGHIVITVLVEGNPKRAGTSAHRKFALLRTSMTVAEYMALEGAYPDLDKEKAWPCIELRWCLQKGWIRLDSPSSSPPTAE